MWVVFALSDRVSCSSTTCMENSSRAGHELRAAAAVAVRERARERAEEAGGAEAEDLLPATKTGAAKAEEKLTI